MSFLPNISVIVPSFNRAHSLAGALQSVVDQQYDGELDVIVIDDGSTDNTAAMVAQEFPQFRLIQQRNQGVSAARNRGIEVARYDWIALLDSDDEWLPNKLTQQQKKLNETGLQVCHTEEVWVRNGVRVNAMKKHQKKGGDIYLQSLQLCAMSPSSILIHRKIFEQVGVFDEALPACEDYDLWLRICAFNQVALVDDACIIKMGGHADQLSRKYWGMDRFRVLALQKALKLELSAQQRDATKTVLHQKLIVLRDGAIKRKNTELAKYCVAQLNALQI